MKLKEFLKQFEGLDPEIEVYKRKGFEDDPYFKEFSKSYEILRFKPNNFHVDSILI